MRAVLEMGRFMTPSAEPPNRDLCFTFVVKAIFSMVCLVRNSVTHNFHHLIPEGYRCEGGVMIPPDARCGCFPRRSLPQFFYQKLATNNLHFINPPPSVLRVIRVGGGVIPPNAVDAFRAGHSPQATTPSPTSRSSSCGTSSSTPRCVTPLPPPLYRLTYLTSCPGFVSRPATPSRGGGGLGPQLNFHPYFGLKKLKGFAEGPCPGGSSYLGDSQQLFFSSHKHSFFSSIFKSFKSFKC